MTRLGGHVTIFSQVPARMLNEFRVNSVHGGARVSLFLFRAVALGLSKYKYAVRRAPLKRKLPSAKIYHGSVYYLGKRLMLF